MARMRQQQRVAKTRMEEANMNLSPELKKGIWFVLVIIVAAGVVIWLLGSGLSNKIFAQQPEVIKLPILMIAGVVALLFSLAVASIAFAGLNLSDKTQALALPEGSVRAVIALCLLVLFAIITIFLFGSLSEPAVGLRAIDGLTDPQKEEFLNKNQNLGSVVVIPYTIGNQKLYTIEYREKSDEDAKARQRAKEDFAKQLLVLVGTLVTAVSSFYFGTRAVASQAETRVPGTLASVKPSKVVAGGSVEQDFEVSGNNLDLIREIKLVKGSDELVGEKVTSNAQVVKFKVSLAKAKPGLYNVVATDANQRVLKLQGAFEIGAAAVAQTTTAERLDPPQAARTAWPKDFKIHGKDLNKASMVRVTQAGGGPVPATVTNKASDTLIFTVQKEKLAPGKAKVEVVDDKGTVLAPALDLDVTD
jgi:hypothetical protein